jgi:toxin YoeB
MSLLWASRAWDEYVAWQSEPKVTQKINALIDHVQRDPFRGLGTSKPLKGDLDGWWVRSITDEHRIARAERTTVVARGRARAKTETASRVSTREEHITAHVRLRATAENVRRARSSIASAALSPP